MKSCLRRVHLIAVFAITSVVVAAQNVSFTKYKNWDSLLATSKQNGKKIFIYFHAPWCAPCKKIEKNIFTDTAVYSLLNSSTINISVDIDDSSFVELTKKYRVISIPVVVLLNEDGFLLWREQSLPMDSKVGFFILLKNALGNNNIERGISNVLAMEYPGFYNDYFQHKPRVAPTKEVVDDYLAQQSNLTGEIAWDVISSFSQSPKEMEYMIVHFDEFKNLYGQEVGEKIGENYIQCYRDLIRKKDSVTFSKIIDIVRTLWKPQDKERGTYFQWIQFLGRSELDWPRFKQLVTDYNANIDSGRNSHFCELMYLTCYDMDLCNYMATLMKPIATKEEINEKNYLIYAALLLKTGQETLADNYFSQAVKTTDNADDKKKCETEIEEIKRSIKNKGQISSVNK